MSTDRARKRKAATALLHVPHDELARHTEEHIALAGELVELARELCNAASELNRIVRLAYISPPTRN